MTGRALPSRAAKECTCYGPAGTVRVAHMEYDLECPHGCKSPSECLRYNRQLGAPADCIIEAEMARKLGTPSPTIDYGIDP